MDSVFKLALSAAAAALLAGVLASVTPKGGGRRVVEMCGGLLLLLVLLRPFSNLAPSPGLWDLDGLLDGAAEASILRDGQELINQIIAERTGAYILNKSEAAGLAIHVNVVCTDDVLAPTPWAVTIRSERPEHARNALSRMLEDELGIPPHRQRFELSTAAGGTG